MTRCLALLSLLVLAGWLSAGAAAQTTPAPQMPVPVPPPTPSAQPPVPPPLPVPPPAPAPQPAEVPEWFYGANGQALGPFTVGYLRDLAARSEISLDTPVWKQGMANWARLADVPELASVVAALPAKPENQPPPPPDSQTMLNEGAKKFLIGTWRFDGPLTQGGITAHVRVEITYRPDGSYAGVQSVQLPTMGGVQPAPQVTARSGRYSVTAIDAQQFVLNMNETGSGPIQVSLKIIDQNTVEDTATFNRSFRLR